MANKGIGCNDLKTAYSKGGVRHYMDYAKADTTARIHNFNAIHTASFYGHTNIIRDLISNGVDSYLTVQSLHLVVGSLQ